MEIIVLIAISLISMLFNKLGNKQEETPRQQRPIPHKPQLSIPKRLEDVAKEFFEDFQEPERRTPEPERPAMKKTSIEPSKVQDREESEVEGKVQPAKKAASISRFGNSSKATDRKMGTTRKEETGIFPKDQRELLQAIIFSEVIGPPKSKR